MFVFDGSESVLLNTDKIDGLNSQAFSCTFA
jgi:hypothetical protein